MRILKDTRVEEANQELRAALDKVLAKQEVSLTPTDVGFLRARRAYLTSADIAAFPSVFPDHRVKEPTEKLIEAQDKTLLFPEKGYRELQVWASELGMGKVVGKSTDQLESFIHASLQALKTPEELKVPAVQEQNQD